MSEEVKTLDTECEELMSNLNDYMVSPSQAEELAHKFLRMCYRVNRKIRQEKDELIKLSILEKMQYSNAFKEVDSKANVSKAKAIASADKNVLIANTKVKQTENAIDYWKGVYEVFNNAHNFYKYLTRE